MKKQSSKLIFLCIAFGLSAIILLLGCGGQTTSTPTSTPAAKTTTTSPTTKPTLTPKPGGIFKIITYLTSVNFGDPAQTSRPADNIWAQAAMENLLDLDTNGQPIPWLATAWQLAPDNKSLTLTLRKGVKFHDGTDFNAEAVKFNLDRYIQSKVGTALNAVTSVDKVDDYTVRLNLSQLEVAFFYNLAGRATAMVSPNAVKTKGTDWLKTNIVGTGPFKLASYTRDTVIKFERNPDYWNKPLPYLDGIEVMFIVDKTTATMSFMAKEAQALRTSGKDAADLMAKGYNYSKNPAGLFSVLTDGSNASSPFSNLSVRQAISYALDTKSITQAIGLGTNEAVNQLSSPDNWSYSPNVKGYPYNPEKARQLLKEAGYPTGFPVTFYGTSSIDQNYFQAIQGALKAVGIDCKIEIVTAAKSSELDTKGWQNGMMTGVQGIGAATNDPSSLLRGSYTSFSGRYVSVLHPKEVEDKMLQALVEFDFNKRKALIWEIQQLIIDKYAMLTPIYQVYDYCMKYPEVQDLRAFESAYPRWRPDIAWLNK